MSNYGEWCPICKAPIQSVTRGIPSLGRCVNGHTTDRRDVLRREPEPAPTFTAADLEAAFRLALAMAAKVAHSFGPKAMPAEHKLYHITTKIRALTPPADLGARVKEVRDEWP
jgi:hypothetical protein